MLGVFDSPGLGVSRKNFLAMSQRKHRSIPDEHMVFKVFGIMKGEVKDG